MNNETIVATKGLDEAGFVLHVSTVARQVPLDPEQSVYADVYGSEWYSYWVVDLLQNKLLGLRVSGVS